MQQQSIPHTKVESTVRPCSCAHPYQDARYGKGQRVHNPCKSGTGVGWTCTVCGSTTK